MFATIQHFKSVTGADQAGVEVNSSQWNEPHVATFGLSAADISAFFSNANGRCRRFSWAVREQIGLSLKVLPLPITTSTHR